MRSILSLSLILPFQGGIEADFRKAEAKLVLSPDDPDANLVVGRYHALVKGDWERALPYLAKAPNGLAPLAKRDLDGPKTAPEQVRLGDDWMEATRKFASGRAFQDRACHWYRKAWPDLEGPLREKLRERLRKLFQNPAAPNPKGLSIPKDWSGPTPDAKAAPSSVAVHTGRYSFQVMAFKRDVKGYAPVGQTVLVKAGATYEFSAWVLTDGTDSPDDSFIFPVYSAEGKPIWHPVVPVLPDQPWWKEIKTNFTVPEGSVKMSIGFVVTSTTGVFFLDDVSVKEGGKEILKNGSFEQ